MRRPVVAALAEVETYFPEAELDPEYGVAWLGRDYIDIAARGTGISEMLRGVQAWALLHHEIAQPMSDEDFKKLLFSVAVGTRTEEGVRWAGVCRVSQLSHQILGAQFTPDAARNPTHATPAIIYDADTFSSRSDENIAAALKESRHTPWWQRDEEDQPQDPEIIRLVQHIARYHTVLGAITLNRCIADQRGQEVVNVAGRIPDEPNGKVRLWTPGAEDGLSPQNREERRVEILPYLAGRIAARPHRSLVRAIMARGEDHKTRDELMGIDPETRLLALMRGKYLIDRGRPYHIVRDQQEVMISVYGQPDGKAAGPQDTYYAVQRFGLHGLRGVYFHHSNPAATMSLESDVVPPRLHVSHNDMPHQGSWIPLNNQLTPLTREIVASFYA